MVTILGEDNDGDGVEDDLVSSGLFIGKPIGTIYDFNTQGIYQLADEKLAGFQAGRTGWKISTAIKRSRPQTIEKILGNTEPAYQFGIQTRFHTNNSRFAHLSTRYKAVKTAI